MIETSTYPTIYHTKKSGLLIAAIVSVLLLGGGGLYLLKSKGPTNLSQAEQQKVDDLAKQIATLDTQQNSLVLKVTSIASFDKDLGVLTEKVSTLEQDVAGFAGPVGPAGDDGEAGPQGSAGVQGDIGVTGAIGATGPQGPSGSATCPNGTCVSLQASSPGVAETGNIRITGLITAGSFSGNGSAVSDVNASQLGSQLPSFYRNASNINSGTLGDGFLSSNVALKDGTNTFSAVNNFTGGLQRNGNNVCDASNNCNYLSAGSTVGVASGGTGATTLTANGVLIGNGTSPISAVAAAGAGLCLVSNAGAPSFQACPGGGGGVSSVNALTGALTIQGNSQIAINAAGQDISLSIQADSIGDSQLAFNTGQHLTTTSSPIFDGLTLTSLLVGLDTITDFTGTGLSISSGSLQTTLGTGIDLTTEVSGILPIANGGTGASTLNDLIALGTNTTGNYVLNNTAGDGISVTGSAGEGWSPTIAVNSTVCRTSGNCAGVGGTGDILQGGNSFTAAMNIGTNDSFDLNLETGGTTKLAIQSDGDIAADTNTFFVDATNNRVGVLTSAPSADLTFGEGSSRTLNVLTRTTNTIGTPFIIQAGTAGSGATAFSGGRLTLQGGNAAGTSGVGNGGDVLIYGGTKADTGVDGDVLLVTDGTNPKGKLGIGTVSPTYFVDIQPSNYTSLASDQSIVQIVGKTSRQSGGTSFWGVSGIRVTVEDLPEVVDGTDPYLNGLRVRLLPRVSRTETGVDDATGIILRNVSFSQTGTMFTATDGFYMGDDGTDTPQWHNAFIADTAANNAFTVTNGPYDYGLLMTAVTINTAAIRIPNASPIVARNGADNGNINLITTNSSNTVTVGPSLTLQSNGLTGVGNSAPQTVLHVKAADPILTIQDTDTGLSTAQSFLRFAESDGSGLVENYWETGATLLGGSNFGYVLRYNGSATPAISFGASTSASNIAIGSNPTGARFFLTGNQSIGAWGTSGAVIRVGSTTTTDSTTATSGTATNAVFTSFGTPTLAATNTGVTTTNAATVYIQASPAAGTNQTITNGYALWIDAGDARFDGNIIPGAASTLDIGSTSLEIDDLYVGDNNGVRFGLDQDALLAYDETTDDRVELTGTGANLFVEDKLGLGVQTFTMSTAGAATENLTPTASYIEITGQDNATDLAQVQTTGAKEGDFVIVTNTSATTVNIDQTATTKLSGGADVVLTQYDVIMLIFDGTNWLQVSDVTNNS